jgi:hypothetical protein
MIDRQLTIAREQLSKRLFSSRSIEYLFLLDPLPRQSAPLLTQLITQPGVFLLLNQQPIPRIQPLLP